jgi:hypothetical protein
MPGRALERDVSHVQKLLKESGINKTRIRSRIRQNAGWELTAKPSVLANAATTRCRFSFVAVPKRRTFEPVSAGRVEMKVRLKSLYDQRP